MITQSGAGTIREKSSPVEKQSAYEAAMRLRSPADALKDDNLKDEIERCVADAIAAPDVFEKRVLDRLMEEGHPEDAVRQMFIDTLAVEWYYDEKYGTDILQDRWRHNIERLPNPPEEIFSVDCAVEVLECCYKGVPIKAIEYLHDDPSIEALNAIIDGLSTTDSDIDRWEEGAKMWYMLAAEGHLNEELIDPIVELYTTGYANASFWLYEQGEYVIGKLAQRYPDAVAGRVLKEMEHLARTKARTSVFYLFDAFDFCDLEKYKHRLVALLDFEDLSWQDALATYLAHLQIKEALPVLKRQLLVLEKKNPAKGSTEGCRLVEIREAVGQLETGEDLYPEVDTPLCLKRKTTWKEEAAAMEEYFYEDNDDLSDEMHDPYPQESNVFYPAHPIISEHKPGRNDPCPCGSGKKYKKCCI